MTLEERVIEEGIHSVIHYAYNRNGWCIRKIEELQGNGPVCTAVTKYGYDAENLRFELLENGRKTSFVYHNGELLHEEGREKQKIILKLQEIVIIIVWVRRRISPSVSRGSDKAQVALRLYP